MDRREFLKLSAAATALAACGGKNNTLPADIDPLGHHTDEVPTDKMTYRTTTTTGDKVSITTGDKVSILGYGMMRLPYKPVVPVPGSNDANADEIDQEQVNRLVKYALDHGVNYFDTSPAYCRGLSEQSTGIALQASGYKRSQYYIATKLSNFSPSQWSHEEGVKMFQNSLKNLRTSYIDYLLLHAIGGGGMDNYRSRFVDNGILDYLLEQRKKGTIRNLGFSYHGDCRFSSTMSIGILQNR